MQYRILRILLIAVTLTGLYAVDSFAMHVDGKPHANDSEYVGSESCGMCHRKAFKAWQKTKLARAIEVLGPKKAVRAKKKMRLDPDKDYTRDPGCLKCHTTGFSVDDNGFTFSEYGIGCEACHGAGKKYSRLMKLKGRNYKRDKMIKLGLITDFTNTCNKCHNENSPVIGSDYLFKHKERYMGVHGVVKLKYHEKIERFEDEDEEEEYEEHGK